MERYTFQPGEPLTAAQMNELLQKCDVVSNADPANLGEGKDSNVMSERAVNTLVKDIHSRFASMATRNVLDEVSGTGPLEIELPAANPFMDNKYMAFVYYGEDNGTGKSNIGMHLLHMYAAYSPQGDTQWYACDEAPHSWLEYRLGDTARGYTRSSVKENKFKFEFGTPDDFGGAKYVVQGWQIV